MPHRPGVDDHASTNDLIAYWRAAGRDIDARSAVLHTQLLEAADTGKQTRLRLALARLRALADDVESVLAALSASTDQWARSGAVDEIWSAGAAVVPGVVGPVNVAAADRIAADAFEDVATMIRRVGAEDRRWIRGAARDASRYVAALGDPTNTATRRLRRRLADRLARRGLGAMVYRDGSRHSFGEYAEVVIRTKTGVAFNSGTLHASRAAGIAVVEILDGNDCGLTFHRDPVRANGLIVTVETAMAYPLAHPNCIRAIGPRPDLTLADVGEAGDLSVIAPGSRADQAAFEAANRGRR